ncbi:hypothetical protein, partial [Enterobacter hormaechei]|uniref:hypothetical protein n=1 Tax=Enterobacter hormaechei TaxID=158836 RepID=UPI0013FDBD53
KAVKQLLLDKSLKHIEINGENLHDYLGVQRFDYGRADSENRVGQVDRSGVDGSGRRSADHKAVKQLLLDKSLKHIEINGENLHDYLGVQRFDY